MSCRPMAIATQLTNVRGDEKTLVRGVKIVADHNGKTGNAPKKHPFEDELLLRTT